MNLWESPEILRIGDRGDGVLRKLCLPVDPTSSAVQRVGKRLLRLLGSDAAGYGVGGIAAPQIRESVRVVAVSLSTGTRVLYNPRLREVSPVSPRENEQCFSLPESVKVSVPRPSWAALDFEDKRGRTLSLMLGGRDARLVAHEIDHLDGVLITDYEEAARARPSLSPASQAPVEAPGSP